MGVPKFFRWILERYPFIAAPSGATPSPIYDSFFIDLNGIIHQCAGSSDPFAPAKSEKEIMLAVFNYIDTLVSIVKPTKLLYIAVDGVAPRAKMNEQRQRRFRSAKDLQKRLVNRKEIEELLKKLPKLQEEKPKQQEGDEKEDGEKGEGVKEEATKESKDEKKDEVPQSEERPFDSNQISPGTEFMERLNQYLQCFIESRINESKQWQQVQVILSGSNDPGEGEHKIAEYIRRMKMQLDHNPNTRYCLYGLDFDIIILGLCFHEPHVSVLREKLIHKSKREGKEEVSFQKTSDFQYIHLNLLRHYLDLELRTNRKTQNFERVLDDFVFFDFFDRKRLSSHHSLS
eukprot:TRINITY_DN9890_c0_g1_i1.p1 TRINITY_DN9890_c0_g1~~TRINITY_DN9890_c0_g1_i1.p1  ORF type:complete len:344 (+),score=80.81 TRINITY_DN9890_c0_g1_i1:117-1148(+)